MQGHDGLPEGVQGAGLQDPDVQAVRQRGGGAGHRRDSPGDGEDHEGRDEGRVRPEENFRYIMIRPSSKNYRIQFKYYFFKILEIFFHTNKTCIISSILCARLYHSSQKPPILPRKISLKVCYFLSWPTRTI